MALRDYYAILGVPYKASQDQIKQAYRRLVRRYHPDLNQQEHDRGARMKLLNEAYEVLSDAARRAAYDALLLEQHRTNTLLELLRRQQLEERRRAERMTWPQGIAGFFKELKKALQED